MKFSVLFYVLIKVRSYVAGMYVCGWISFCVCVCCQAIDELKQDLFKAGVDYTEETLVVVENDVIEGLSRDTFVSLFTCMCPCWHTHFTHSVCWFVIPALYTCYRTWILGYSLLQDTNLLVNRSCVRSV